MEERLKCPVCGMPHSQGELAMSGRQELLRCGLCRTVSLRSEREGVNEQPDRVRVDTVERPLAPVDASPFREGWQPQTLIVRTKTSAGVRGFGVVAAAVALFFLYLAVFRDHPVWGVVIDYAMAAFFGLAGVACWMDSKIELDGEAMTSRVGERLGRNRVKAIRCRKQDLLYLLEAECDDGKVIELNSFEEPEEAVYVMTRLEEALRLNDEDKTRFAVCPALAEGSAGS